MRAFVVSDNETATVQVRQVLQRAGLECPAAQVVSLEHAPARLAQAAAELTVLVLSPDPDRALAVLGELSVSPQHQVLAIGPAADSKLILRTVRAGAHEYLDELDVESELESALVRLRLHHSETGQTGHTIAILAPSGGSGSSTLAVNVATALAKVYESVALVDLKLE